jgi:hypothetical protein
MAVLPDWMIRERVWRDGLIDPFILDKIRDKGPSRGLSSAGYDASLGHTLWIARPGAEVIDLADLPT